jgi:PBP1b-binding outer membrane lipoprotein LpoB
MWECGWDGMGLYDMRRYTSIIATLFFLAGCFRPAKLERKQCAHKKLSTPTAAAILNTSLIALYSLPLVFTV